MKIIDLAATAIAVSILSHAEAVYAGSSLRIASEIADNEIVALTQTCDPSTGLPPSGEGACAGIETINGSISGGLNATYYAEVNFAVLATGEAQFTSFDIITGSVDGHGSGSFTIFEDCTLAATLKVTCRWNVVPDSGTDELVGITGRGRTIATYDPSTGLASGRLIGVLHF